MFWFQDSSEELTDTRLVKLSNTIATESELRMLGTQGLNVGLHEIDKQITNNRNISSAAYHVLYNWRKTQEDNTVAYKNLCDALKSANLELKIQNFK